MEQPGLVGVGDPAEPVHRAACRRVQSSDCLLGGIGIVPSSAGNQQLEVGPRPVRDAECGDQPGQVLAAFERADAQDERGAVGGSALGPR